MNAPVAPPLKIWQQRWLQIRGAARRGLPFASGAAAAVVTILLYSVLFPAPHQMTQNEVDTLVAQAMASATAPPPYSSLVYQAIQPSLVLIQSQIIDVEGFAADGGLGTGVIINDAGDILTSLHVVSNEPSIIVTFADGTESSAEIIAAQPENDIAVLRANQLPELFFPAVLGNPNAMRVGDEAYVVGHPFGLYSSMSAGVISGFERSFQIPDTGQTLTGLIQVDAAINPGNSGGPLVNREGQVVGIVTALLNPTSENVFIGIGFAVPITTAGGAAGAPPV
ncbi:MAG: trypsin-like peptidase domain-containing protein [Anaerolineae bacterium]|nr:trypsin-like peptidase domain-containing protein [Anaerolineae bacterium]